MLAVLCAATGSWAVPAAGADPVSAFAHGPYWFSIGVLSGSAQPDAHLADYQWDTRPHPAFGAQALAGRGRLAAGLRLWSTQTTQTIDVGGTGGSPTVRSTTVEFVSRGRLISVLGMPLSATASVGVLHLGYHPDQVSIDPGGGSPVVVDLAPIDEWTGGAGLALTRTLASKWNVGIGIDYGRYRLDTAHRDGAVIVNSRESFGQWNARFEVARLIERR